MPAGFVAIGDSMSIDDYAGGPGRGAASLLHRNRDNDFPDWAGRDLATATIGVQVLARDGATASDVLLYQLPRIAQTPQLVTITMGGNDLMVAYGNTQAAEAAIAEVAATGEAILTRLAAVTRNGGRIVLTTVYDPSDGTGQIPTAGLSWSDGPALIRALNAELAALAQRHGAVVADVHARFLGHGSNTGDPAQPDPRPSNRQLWYCGVIEPNAWGAHEIRTTWWQALHNSGWSPPPL